LEDIIGRVRNRFGKAIGEDQGYFYSIVIYEGKEPTYVLCINKRTNRVIYGKIALFNKVSSLNCDELLYDPNGLYLFAKNPEEFLNKLLEKIKYLV
jgi:hypothetical protein